MPVSHPLQIDTVPIDSVVPHPQNPRRGDVEAIAESIRVHGFYAPAIVQRSSGRIIAGNHRWKALRALGRDTVDVVFLDISDAEALQVLLIDNKSSDDATYDEAALAELLQSLDGDFAGTGWDESDLDALLEELQPDIEEPAGDALPEDIAPAAPPSDPVSRPGDLWQLGPHRLICGDSRDFHTVTELLAGASINIAFTSPPYADARTYDPTSGFTPIPPDEYVEWFADVQANVRAHLAGDGSWFVNIKAKADGLDTPLYVLDLVIAHVRQWGWHFATEFCWERTGMPKSVTRRFKNQFEPIYQFTIGEWKMRPQAVMHASSAAIAPQGAGAGNTSWGDDLSQRGFDADRVGEGMAYPGNRLPPFATESTGHTAAFPVGLPTWFLRAYTDPGDVVFDPFLGAGSTLIAAHNEDRVAYGTEISPAYCDVIARRFQRHTGIVPLRVPAGGGDPVPHSFADTP